MSQVSLSLSLSLSPPPLSLSLSQCAMFETFPSAPVVGVGVPVDADDGAVDAQLASLLKALRILPRAPPHQPAPTGRVVTQPGDKETDSTTLAFSVSFAGDGPVKSQSTHVS